MTGICSAHHPSLGSVKGCAACHATLEDLLGADTVAVMRAEAKAAGEFTCDCGFTYYKTVDDCPLCGRDRPLIILS